MKSILVVEDDADIARDLQALLEEEGFQVSVAGNGKIALEWLRAAVTPPSLLLLDLMMPVMNGFEFLEERRKNAELAKLPVVVMTAGAFSEPDKATSGIQAFIRKPLDLDRFLNTIQRCLGNAAPA